MSITRRLALIVIGFGLVVNGYSQSFLTDGLLAFYPFKRSASDASGNGFNATVHGNHQYLADGTLHLIGDGQLFYNEGGYVSLPNYGDLNSGFTISIWVGGETDHGNGIYAESYIWFDNNNGNYLVFYQHDFFVQGPTAFGDLPLAINDYAKWKQLVLSYSPGDLAAYMNGVLVGRTNVTVSPFPFVNSAIGRHWWAGGANSSARMTMDVKNYRIYSRAMSSNEIAQLYEYESTPKLTDGLVAYYPFNGNAEDEGGNGNDCTASGSYLDTDRFGETQNSYRFATFPAFLATSTSTGFPEGNADFSISLWVAPSLLTNDHQIIFCNGSVNDFQLDIWPTTNGTSAPMDLLLGGDYGPPDVHTADVPWVANQWYNLQIVRSSNTLTIYRDATIIGQNQVTNGVNAPADLRYLQFGLGVSPQLHQFRGRLDDIRIYNRALTQAEVLQLYNAEVSLSPVFTAHPHPLTVSTGNKAAFAAAASGTPPLYFQWRKDGVNLPGATSTSLTLTNAQPPHIGDYTVVASNSHGSATSAVASLSISGINPALWQGLVAYYPFNGNARDESGFGDDGTVLGATLSADRFGMSHAAYFFSATNGDNITAIGSNLPRSQSPRTVSLWCKPKRQNYYSAGLMHPPQKQYALLGWGNPVASGEDFTLLLNNWNGVRAGYSTTASTPWNYDLLPLDEVWHHIILSYSGGSNLICHVDGRATALGNLSPAALWDTGAGVLSLGRFGAWSFDGEIDDVRIYNRALSGLEAQTLYAAEAGLSPRITNVIAASVYVGQSVTLSVAATGAQPIFYQWYDRYNNPLPTATNTSLFFKSAGATNLGEYRVEASNTWGTVSAAVQLTVNNPYDPVYLPLSKVVPGSELVSLVPNGDLEAVAATNAAGLLLPASWSATPDLTLWNATNKTTANGSSVLAAFVTNHYNAAVLSQQIALEPNTEYVLSGYFWNMGDASNKVNTAFDAYDVAWDPQVNFGPDFRDADKGVFVYRKFHSAAAGTNITLRVFYGSLTGNGASASYYPLAAQWDNIAITKSSQFTPPQYTAPYIAAQPVNRSVASGTSLQFSVKVTAAEPTYYQWLHNGSPIRAATNRILTILSATGDDAGLYSLVISNSYGSVTSSNASLVVRPSGVPAVASGPVTNSANGHLYFLLQPSSWQEAEQAAIQLGGHLVSIQDQSEENWVFNTFNGIRHVSFWIGLFDPDPLNNATNVQERRSEFIWSSGEPMTYTNWEVSEPNNYQEMGEFCGEIFGQDRGSLMGFWNDTTDYSTGIAEVNPPPAIVVQPQSQTVMRGSVVSFSPSVSGASPQTFQWRKAGANVPGGTNLTLTLTDVQLSDAGAYKLIVSNWAGVATTEAAVLIVTEPLTLAEALDAPGYLWTTGGNRPWQPQTNSTFDNADAAVSGTIADYQQTWVETVVNGPGLLSFKWRASSEFGFDYLAFLVDEVERVEISGGTGWLSQTQALAAGQHKLRWVYSKDGSDSVGQDKVWLDQVAYAPSPGVLQPVHLLDATLRQADGLFQFEVVGEPGKPITIETSTNLINWATMTTISNLAGVTRIIDPESTARLARYYRTRTP